ncbi:MAG TPA: SEC-C domain-containing protein [Solirubrobacteraceae bacterium]|nr:SEC-C domain-containing protein [Solirubrobacteraceae bacterium]
MTTELDSDTQAVARARLAHTTRTQELGDLHDETVAAASELALALVRAERAKEGVSLVRDLATRATERLGEESAVTGRLRLLLADVLRRSGAPEAEQLSCLTEAITALSAGLGPSHAETTAAFAQLAIVALEAEAVEVAVTAGMQALGGLQTRGEGETPAAGGVYATLAMAAAARRSPAALGAAERAHALTASPDASEVQRGRATAVWRGLGMPRRLAVTDELSVIAFGSPPSLVVELAHVADDGAVDQHNHGLHPDGARALRAEIATAPFAWRASSGGFEVVSRTGGGGAVRFTATSEDSSSAEALLDAPAMDRLREAVRDALSGSGIAAQPARNDPCPCGSGLKYKRCCGR